MCDAVIAGTVRFAADPRRANMARVVFAGGAFCASRWAIGANEGRSALVIVTGASTSCGVALRRDLVSRMPARRGQHRHIPRPLGGALRCGWRRAEPQWRAFGRWCNCLEWLQAASGGAQSAATLTNRPGLRVLHAVALRAAALKRPRGPRADVEVATKALKR